MDDLFGLKTGGMLEGSIDLFLSLFLRKRLFLHIQKYFLKKRKPLQEYCQ